MDDAVLVTAAVFCAISAVRAKRLLASAIWLAAVSALVALIFYRMGAREVAVIELSVGAGLVTVLFVYAIGVAGEDAISAPALVPRPLAWGLVILTALLLGGLALPLAEAPQSGAEPSFAAMLWQQRGLDVLVQVALIFAGVLGILGVLAERRQTTDNGRQMPEYVRSSDEEKIAL
jgi:uncharacterized MnhB-related membrane protein